MEKETKREVMIVVGEASGDSHAAKLVKELHNIYGENISFFGATGARMRAERVETVVEADQFGIMGLLEVGKAIPMFLRVFRKLKRIAIQRKPDVVVLVDFPEFNLKLAKVLKKNGLRVVYYISPQLWAWRTYRREAIRKYVDLLLTILPFEKNWYEERGITNVEYVGNPLAGEVEAYKGKDEFCRENGIDPLTPIISLLPGSRRKEVIKILPVLLEAAKLLEHKIPSVQFVIPVAANRSIEEILKVKKSLEERGGAPIRVLRIVHDQTYDALNASDAAAVTSGTATLETALIGTPFVMVYLTSNVNWRVFTPFISTEFFSLVNLISRRATVKELLQHDFTPASLAGELENLLEPEMNLNLRSELFEIREKLGEAGASKRAALLIYNLLEDKDAQIADGQANGT